MTSASVNEPHAVPANAFTGPRLQTPVSPAAEKRDRIDHREECKTFRRRPKADSQQSQGCRTVGGEAAGLPTLRYSNMVPHPVARRRKSAQTKSVNPSRKRRRGCSAFSRKMVISSDRPGFSITPRSVALAHTRARKIMEVSRVSPKSNQLDFSDYTNDGREGRANQAISIRQPLCCDDLKTGLEITDDASPSEQLPSDNFLQNSNQGGDWYAGVIVPSSSDSEHNGIEIDESEESEFYGLAESVSHMEIFAHLRSKLQQLVVIRLSLRKEKTGSQNLLHRTQAMAEVMKRLDLLSETWTNCSIDDKAQRSQPLSSPDLGSSVLSNSHGQFEQLGEISCKHFVEEQPLQSELVRVIDRDLPPEINAKISSDPLDRKYWTPKSNADILGSNQRSQNEEWNQQERLYKSAHRGKFSGEERARGSRLTRNTQVPDLMNIELPCSPKMCTRLHSWQQDRTSMSSPPTPPKLSPVKTCDNGTRLTLSPSDSVVIPNDTSQKDFLAICSITAAKDEDCNSTTTGQQAEKVLEPWKSFEDHQSSPTAALFKNRLESRDSDFSLLISTKPNEMRLTSLEQAPTDLAMPEDESYSCYWDTTPASIDCQEIEFAGSDNWEIGDEAEGSEFPALQGFDVCAREYEEQEEDEETFYCGCFDPRGLL